MLSYEECKELFKNVIDAETVGSDENLKELKNSSLKTPMSISNLRGRGFQRYPADTFERYNKYKQFWDENY